MARQWMKQKRSEGRGMDNLDDMQGAEAMHATKKKMITFGRLDATKDRCKKLEMQYAL